MHQQTRVHAAEEPGHAFLCADLDQRVQQTTVLHAQLGLASDDSLLATRTPMSHTAIRIDTQERTYALDRVGDGAGRRNREGDAACLQLRTSRTRTTL